MDWERKIKAEEKLKKMADENAVIENGVPTVAEPGVKCGLSAFVNSQASSRRMLSC